MKKVVVFETACGSANMGDYIIQDSLEQEIYRNLSNEAYIIRFSTHMPTAHMYQLRKNVSFFPYEFCKKADYKFINGTNIVQTDMMHLTPSWNVNIFNCMPYEGSILVGAGSTGGDNFNWYTRKLYSKIFSDKYIHSVRDEKTKGLIESLGFKAINTGCVTMWKLTDDFCAEIPKRKARNVVFTLTDYSRNPDSDQQLIDLLKRRYETVLFWVQGMGDYSYFSSLNNTEGIRIVSPNISAYDTILNSEDLDYVGTRLHAGLYAMQHKKRAIILTVDNRARDIQMDYNINAIKRTSIDEIEEKICSEFKTQVGISTTRIKEWKSQFI